MPKSEIPAIIKLLYLLSVDSTGLVEGCYTCRVYQSSRSGLFNNARYVGSEAPNHHSDGLPLGGLGYPATEIGHIFPPQSDTVSQSISVTEVLEKTFAKTRPTEEVARDQQRSRSSRQQTLRLVENSRAVPAQSAALGIDVTDEVFDTSASVITTEGPYHGVIVAGC